MDSIPAVGIVRSVDKNPGSPAGNYITLHYITVFSAGPTTTRTGPAIQVSTISNTKTKTMNVKSRYVNVKKVSLQPATKRCDGVDSSQ